MRNLFLLLSLIMLASCTVKTLEPVEMYKARELPNGPVTTRNAAMFNLEAPLRCNVNWDEQEVISAVPFNKSAVEVIRDDEGDNLPRYFVKDFSFATMPSEEAVARLVKQAGIKIVVKDGPYVKISAEKLRGEMKDIIDMVSSASGFFYRYDEKNKILNLSREEKFRVKMPKSETMLLGILDVIRGNGIKEVLVDWEDMTITFTADAEKKAKVEDLIGYLDKEPVLIAFDVNVFRVFPQDGENGIKWQSLLKYYGSSAIKLSSRGVLGRILVTSSEINSKNIGNFFLNNASFQQVAEGKFVVPNSWRSRFDVGRCGRREDPEADLSILSKATLDKNNRLSTEITLDTLRGELTKFDVRNRFGENFLIIGVPSSAFGIADDFETVVLMSPRIVRVVKTASKK